MVDLDLDLGLYKMNNGKTNEEFGTGVCVDVHTHLTDSHFNGLTIVDVIGRAKSKKRLLSTLSGMESGKISRFEDVHLLAKIQDRNVKAAVVVTESRSDFEPVLSLHKSYPDFVLPCLGIHPVQSTGSSDERGIDIKRSVCLQDYEGVETFIENSLETICGIGEVGLDFSPRFCKTQDDKESQRLILSKQVQLAQAHNLPVNVHSRSAGIHTIKLLKELNARTVLLHAFDGRASVAMDGASQGFFFSVPASVCRDSQIQKMVKSLPIDQLMLETDSPAIAPVKGEINEPANVVISCEHIAKIKQMDVQHVKQITTENAVKVFPKLKPLLNQLNVPS